jgi:hypothetical protein
VPPWKISGILEGRGLKEIALRKLKRYKKMRITIKAELRVTADLLRTQKTKIGEGTQAHVIRIA